MFILYNVGIIILLIVLSSCGTLATYKTAELTKHSQYPTISVAASIQSIPVKYDREKDKLSNEKLITPEIGVWKRLFKENSKYDAGINIVASFVVNEISPERYLTENK